MSGGIQRTSSTVSSVSEIDESTQDSMPDTLNVEVCSLSFNTNIAGIISLRAWPGRKFLKSQICLVFPFCTKC